MWIVKALDVNYPDMPISNYSYMADTDNVEEVCKMIDAFGTGITGFKMIEISVEKVLSHLPQEFREKVLRDLEQHLAEAEKEQGNYFKGLIMRSSKDFFIIRIKGNEVSCQTIQFEHGKKNILFSLDEESDGTIRVLDLLEILLSDSGMTYVIDELDRCLHPSLTYKFVEVFLQMAAWNDIQLIVTTH